MRSMVKSPRRVFPVALFGIAGLGACVEDKEARCEPGTQRSDRGMCIPSDGAADTGSQHVGSQDTGESDTGTAVTSPFSPADPHWEISDVQATIEALVSTGYFGPNSIRSLYLERMSHGDGWCPDSPVQISDLFVFGCTTVDGWWFSGIATYEELDGPEPWDGTGRQWSLSGDFEIIDPTSAVYRVGGEAGRKETTDGVWSSWVLGSWSQDSHAHSWIAAGMSAMLFVTASDRPEASKAILHGGLGDGETNLYFDTLRWKETGCWAHPTGTIMARDPSQYWWTLEFDSDCSGCADLRYAQGEVVGQLCPDLGSLRDEIIADGVPQ